MLMDAFQQNIAINKLGKLDTLLKQTIVLAYDMLLLLLLLLLL
jgi:hypothetical protein